MTGSEDFGLFCNPESRRTEGFSIALGRSLRQRPILIPWERVISNGGWSGRLRPSPRFLRLESPGRNWTVERLLLMVGSTIEDEESARGWRRLPSTVLESLTNDPGRVLPMRQWFLGWREVLSKVDRWAQQHAPTTRWFSPPADVTCMFDKLACHQRLERNGFPVPPSLGTPANFDEVWNLMNQTQIRRVFIKPSHGSSASGVVALESTRREMQAFSTLEVLESGDGLQLYNRRRIQTYRGAAEVRRLVDAVCAERCIVEQWIPKAGICSKPFDLRVVVIGGKARHVVVRLGNGPITNSQLMGGRSDPQIVRDRMGTHAWNNVLSLCEEAMRKCFPQSLYAGFDMAIEPNFRTARILEVNAFGDLLPRVLHEAKDTYTWEIEEALRRELTDQVS